MDVESFRDKAGWTLDRLADELGLNSKGYLSDLRSGRQTWPVELALRMEVVSDGLVRAVDLVPSEKRPLLENFSFAPASPGASQGASPKEREHV